jgi:hypothetical protein
LRLADAFFPFLNNKNSIIILVLQDEQVLLADSSFKQNDAHLIKIK